MQGLCVVCLIFEELSNVDVKCVKVIAARNIGHGHQVGICQVSTLRRSTMQGLMVVGLIVEEISNVDAKCVKVTGAQNIGQDHRIKVLAKSGGQGDVL